MMNISDFVEPLQFGPLFFLYFSRILSFVLYCSWLYLAITRMEPVCWMDYFYLSSRIFNLHRDVFPYIGALQLTSRSEDLKDGTLYWHHYYQWCSHTELEIEPWTSGTSDECTNHSATTFLFIHSCIAFKLFIHYWIVIKFKSIAVKVESNL